MPPRWPASTNGGAGKRALARLEREEQSVQQPLVRGLAPRQSPKRTLECLRCYKRYSAQDIEKGNYRLETMICSFCYAKMQQAPYPVSCFGKPSYARTAHQPHKLYGYQASALECRLLCPDRQVCRLVVLGPDPGKP